MAFVIDTGGSKDNTSNNQGALSKLLEEYKQSLVRAKTPEKKSTLENFFQSMGWTDENNIKAKKAFIESTDSKSEVDELLKKSVITPDFDKLHAVPPVEVTEKKRREQRRKQRELTKGNKWFGLPATELTPEIKNDLEIIQMRSVLDPKRFYKKNDLKVLPKYFQVGKVLDSSLDHYNNRLTKKERKRTLVEELMADAEFNKYNKRKYKEIIQEKQKTHYKEWKKAKKLKKKRK